MADTTDNRAMIILPDNPFKTDIERFRRAMKPTSKSHSGVGYKHRRITVIEETEYFPGAFTKIYQNRELLRGLSPDACKILIHMATEMEWNDQKVNLTPELVGIERRRFSKAMLELMESRILLKERPHWYWVNVTVVVIGHIEKESPENQQHDNNT